LPVIIPANILAPLTGTPQVVPVDLPVPSFVNDADGLDPTLVLNDMVAAYELATSRTLYPAQVEQLLIDLYAYRETLIRNAIQACGVQNLLAFAAYPMLDYLGEYLNCPRLPAQPATTTILFTLSATQSSATTIPQNSLVGTTDGTYVFYTTQALVIPAGGLTGSVNAACTTGGSGGNGYLASTTPPQVSIILGSLPLVSTAGNTVTTANGSEGEPATTAGDNHFRTRIQAAPNNLTTAGPSNQYRSLALDVSDTIVDAQIPTTPTIPGTVTVYILTGPVSQPAATPNAAGLASGSLISTVTAALSAQTVRPLCDSVVVSAVTEVDYTVSGAIILYANANYATLAAGITAAAQAMALTLAASISQDIVQSQWEAALSVQGVYDVDIVLAANIGGTPLVPTPDGSFVLGIGQWANCVNINLTIVNGTKNQAVS
jgi:phage-related baseplate assembly protein